MDNKKMLSFKIDRRHVLFGLATCIFSGLNKNAYAKITCGSASGLPRWCDANILTSKFLHVQAIQKEMYWCWAATLEMIFRWHGRNISQESIVMQTFGTYANLPANPYLLMKAIKRSYQDADGNSFYVSSKTWSADFGTNEINNRDIINNLTRDKPMIICNISHMMALVGVNFIEDMYGNITLNEGWVADPFIKGSVTDSFGAKRLPSGFRYLLNLPAKKEFTAVQIGGEMRFLAEVNVS
jgi:hypothetical protein